MSDDNVIQFPKDKIAPPQTISEIELLRRETNTLKRILIGRSMITMINAINQCLADENINIDGRPDTHKNMQLLIDAGQALISKFYNAPHFLHQVADKTYESKDGSITPVSPEPEKPK